MSDELHVPVNQPVRLVITSEDVLHSVYVPAFRVKMDAVPGRFTKAWFDATQTGEYPLFCAEYCGTDHSNMNTIVVVHERGQFEKWLEDAANYIDRIAEGDVVALSEAGRDLYRRKGCLQCHSIDGTVKNGPTFKGMFGKVEPMRDGSQVEVEENYIRESVLDPQAKVLAGFDPIMPTFKGKLKDKEILAIIEYIKSLKE